MAALPWGDVPGFLAGRYTKMGRTSIYAGIKSGIFPKPIKIGRSSRWLRSEVEAAIAKLASQRA